MSTPKIPQLTEQQLIQVLPILSANIRNINVTAHAEQRMKKRKITYDDVLNILNNPQKLLDTRFKDNSYKYKICGVDKNKHIVIAIDRKREMHIVTVINKLYNF